MPATVRDVQFKYELACLAFDRMKKAEKLMQVDYVPTNMDPTEFRKRHEKPTEFVYHLGAFLNFASSAVYYTCGILGRRDNTWERAKRSEIFQAVGALRDKDIHANVVTLIYRQTTGTWPISTSPPFYAVDVNELPQNPRNPVSPEALHVLKVSGITWFIPPFLHGLELMISHIGKSAPQNPV